MADSLIIFDHLFAKQNFRRDSKFWTHLKSSDASEKKKKNMETSGVVIDIEERIEDDEDFGECLTPILAPLATKEFKRRKSTDFIFSSVDETPYAWHPHTISYTYPSLSSPYPSVSKPFKVNGTMQTAPAVLKKKKISTVPQTGTGQELTPTPKQKQISQDARRTQEKEDEMHLDDKGTLSEDSLGVEDLQPVKRKFDVFEASPSKETNSENFTPVIVDALRALGGRGTGMDVTDWILTHYDELAPNRKRLCYTVNAILSSKKHSGLFLKEAVVLDGNKRALWKLSEEKASEFPHLAKINTKKATQSQLGADTFGGQYRGQATDEESETDKEDATRKRNQSPNNQNQNDKDQDNEGAQPSEDQPDMQPKDSSKGNSSHSDKPRDKSNSDQKRTDTDKHELKSVDVYKRRKLTSAGLLEVPIIDGQELMFTDKQDARDLPHLIEGIDDDESLANLKKKNAPLSKRRKGSSLEDGLDKSPDSTQVKMESDSDNHAPDESFVGSSELDDESSKEDKSKGNFKKEHGIDEDEFFDQIFDADSNDSNSGDDSNSDTEDSKKHKHKNGSSKKSKSKKKKRDSENEEDDDEHVVEGLDMSGDDASTYTEMIVHALRALGGRGTGQEITSYIDETYFDILQNKTGTWRNSVMGCLSANRRHLFSKEPVKQYAKRYVWVLNEPETKRDIYEAEPILKKSKPKKPSSIVEDINDLGEDVSEEEEKSGTEEEIEGSDTENNKEKSEEITEVTSPISSEDKKSKPANKKSIRDRSVEFITEALISLGGKGTGAEIAEWLSQNHTIELGTDLKKIAYMVNAVMSSKKYKDKFTKDKKAHGNQRILWKLASE